MSAASDEVIEWFKVVRTPTGMTVSCTQQMPSRNATAKWGVKAYEGVPKGIAKAKAEARAGASKALAELIEEE